jgi:hypothetical protein
LPIPNKQLLLLPLRIVREILNKLLNYERYDEFHVAGYGFSAVVGLNLAIYKHFFIQSEFKGGFINMPNIRTTISLSDGAEQSIFFSKVNIVFGATFKFRKPKQ